MHIVFKCHCIRVIFSPQNIRNFKLTESYRTVLRGWWFHLDPLNWSFPCHRNTAWQGWLQRRDQRWKTLENWWEQRWTDILLWTFGMTSRCISWRCCFLKHREIWYFHLSQQFHEYGFLPFHLQGDCSDLLNLPQHQAQHKDSFWTLAHSFVPQILTVLLFLNWLFLSLVLSIYWLREHWDHLVRRGKY